MAMSLPLSPLSSVSDIQSPSSVNNNASSNNTQQQDQSTTTQPATTIPPTATTTSPTSPTQMKRKPSRRANTAERRATHNAVERQRRETLNGRFLDLAALLPNLSQIRRPSKSSIVNSSIAYIHASRRHHLLASRELRLLKSEADHLRFEINEWRDRAGLMRVEEPVRGEGFSIVISGEMEVVQATLKGGLGPGARGRRGRGDGEGDDDDGDEDDEGEGEDGMVGLGGYGGSYMEDLEDEINMDGSGGVPTSSPLQLVGGFGSAGGSVSASTPSSMQPPSQMHLHHVHQQMALNDIAAAAAAAHHLEDMDDPRIANILLKNGNGNGNLFAQGSSAPNGFGGFHQQQQQSNSYNPHHQQQQQQQQQQYQQAFPASYLADKMWNDRQYSTAAHHHQMMQPQAPRSLFNEDHQHHHQQQQQQQQQYHQPILSVNTSSIALDSSLNDKSNFRTTTTAVKAKVANAKANARVKARTNSISHHVNMNNLVGSPNSSSTHNSPASPLILGISGNNNNPSPIPSPTSSSATSLRSSHQQQQAVPVAMMRRSGSGSPGGASASRSGSESAVGSPSYELHSHSGEYVGANGGGAMPRRRESEHVGFMGLGGMGMVGGMVGGMNGMATAAATNGHGHGHGGSMMMMMM